MNDEEEEEDEEDLQAVGPFALGVSRFGFPVDSRLRFASHSRLTAHRPPLQGTTNPIITTY